MELWQYVDRLVLAVVGLVVAPVSGYAFMHALRQRHDAFEAVGKQTKGVWLAITGGSTLFLLVFPAVGVLLQPTFFGALGALQGLRGPTSLFWIAGLVATLVYLVDVKPAIVGVQGGGHN